MLRRSQGRPQGSHGKLYEASIADHVCARDLVMDRASSRPSNGQREQANKRLPNGRPRTVHRDNPLLHHDAPEGSTRDAPARDVVGRGDAEEQPHPRTFADQARERCAQGEVDHGRSRAIVRRDGDPWRRLPASNAQQVDAHEEVMDRKLGDTVKRQRKQRAVAIKRGDQAAPAGLEAKPATRSSCQNSAFDRPFDGVWRHLVGTEANQLDGAEPDRVVA